MATTVGIITALLTAIYSWRLIFKTFHGKFNNKNISKSKIKESGLSITIPLGFLILGSIFSGFIFKDLLIGKIYNEGSLSISESIQLALQDVVGSYGLVALCSDEPDVLVGARLGSPLVLGIGEGENFLASDASPIIPFTRNNIHSGRMLGGGHIEWATSVCATLFGS